MPFDLLGDPIPANLGERGRNEHAPSPEIARKIRVMLVAGMTRGQIAKQVGLSVPTLRKHYFQSGKVNARLAKEMAIAEERAKLLLLLDAQAAKGNVGAINAMAKHLDRAERELLEDDLRRRRQDEPESKGKKEQRVDHALEAEAALQAELAQPAKRLN